MIRTVITPEKEVVSLHLPKSYIGKKIEILAFTVDELIEAHPQHHVRPGDFRGLLTPAEAELYNQHIEQARNQWNTDF